MRTDCVPWCSPIFWGCTCTQLINYQGGFTIKSFAARHPLTISLRRNWDLYLLIIPVILFFILFFYMPMYGAQIAFKDYIASKGIWDSPFVGFKHFERFFRSYHFWSLIKNTLGVSIYQLALGFPMPVLLALMVNELKGRRIKKFIQTVTYAPNFLSTVVLVGILTVLLSPRNGIINEAIKALGGEPVYFMAQPEWFKSLYVLSGIWQTSGWTSIVYVAALAGIDTQQYEAAKVDGASKFQRLIYVTLPGIIPTMITMLILNTGQIMNVGFEKVFLMQNDLNLVSSNVISTYVYQAGLLGSEFSFSSAVGLFNSVINFSILLVVNKISKKTSGTSLW